MAELKSRPRDSEATRRRILDAAKAEFARVGLGGARVDEIAARAEANKRMIYHYFGSKEDLFQAVVEEAYLDIREAEQALALDHLSPPAALEKLVRFTWSYYLDNPEFLTIVNSETLADNPDFGKALVGAWYEVMGILESDTEEGAKARAALGQASGTDQAGYESQLKGMKMFWTPTDSLTFIQSDEAYQAMDSVRQFSFE